MKTHALLGFILIAAGIIVFAYQGVTGTLSEKAGDPGPMHQAADRASVLPTPSIAGALALAGGIVLLAAGGKRKPRKESKRQYGRRLL